MESMRSLNRSLPSSSPKPSRSTQPPEQLLQAFRTAALSVTNLYKTAVSDRSVARQSGYQDALDDILTFLDKENLGLCDGEGWKVRQWATERLDGSPPGHAGSESEEERGESEKKADSTSPVLEEKTIPDTAPLQSSSRSSSPVRVDTVREPSPPSAQDPITLPKTEFSFRSTHEYPPDTDMQARAATPDIVTTPDPQSSLSEPTHHPALRVEFMPRNSRTSNRHINHSNRHNTRMTSSSRSLGSSAGTKRKTAFGDFFDISSVGDGRDSCSGNSKRNRLN